MGGDQAGLVLKDAVVVKSGRSAPARIVEELRNLGILCSDPQYERLNN